MSGNLRERFLKKEHIKSQGGGGHGGHGAGQEGEQFRAGHARQIGSDGGGRFNPHEDVGRAGQSFRSRELQSLSEEPSEQPDDRLNETQVVPDRHQGGEEDDGRQDLGRQDKSD